MKDRSASVLVTVSACRSKTLMGQLSHLAARQLPVKWRLRVSDTGLNARETT